MTSEPSIGRRRRREFLTQVCGGLIGSGLVGGAGAASALSGDSRADEPQGLPTIQLGKHTVTRLISGGNPIEGFSHSTENMSRHMREYFTLDRTVEYLEKCVRSGINTWQFDYFPKCADALRLVRERGSELQFICLHSESRSPLKVAIDAMKPIAVVHHGGVTDSLFRQGKADEVHDFVKRVHDFGLLAGVSSHNPDNIRRISEEGWENDLFMTCFYFVSRTADEQRKVFGEAVVHEPFFEEDPLRMTEVIQKLEKPCLAFKILAAGRQCNNQPQVEKAFQFAFQRIKKTDAVIVGMYPRYEDEISLNVSYARKYGTLPKSAV